ncbi:MAG: arylsulfatase [Verrucomicrobiota bacterium]
MLNRFAILISALCFSSGALSNEKPNILLIIADDLGFSDLGCYGGEIETPHLDSLAEAGLRYSQFYNTARCWPTRSSLLTGFYAQQIRRDSLPDIPSGGRGERPDWASLLPKLLQPAGYRSYHTGKWHIDGMPLESGFDRSYYLKDQGRFFSPEVHYLDDEKLPPVERGNGYYATTALSDHVIEVLQEHAEQFADRPFFHYLAFAAPHFPLHALPEDIALYDEVYRPGWEAIRKSRWQRIQELGLLKPGSVLQPSAPETHLGPPYHFPDAFDILGPGEIGVPAPWKSLTELQKGFQTKKMAIHAAMIHRMDLEIGRVLDQIRAMGVEKDTLVMFLSDNGASAEIMVRSDGHDPEAEPGSAATYLCLGPGWSTACNTPFRRHKTWTHEGGTSTPFIISWPNGIDATGEIRHTPGHVIDVVPTLLELTEMTLDANAPKSPGKSLVPTFKGDTTNPHEALWWFHDQHKAIRIGDWKAVSPKDEPWELYDLSRDRIESNDLSQSHPEKLQQLVSEWEHLTTDFIQLATEDLSPEQLAKAKGKQDRPDAMLKAQEEARKNALERDETEERKQNR